MSKLSFHQHHDLNHQNKISEPQDTSCVPFSLILLHEAIEGGGKREDKKIAALGEILDNRIPPSRVILRQSIFP